MRTWRNPLDRPAPQDRYRRAQGVAFRQVADEVLIVPIRTDPAQKVQFFSLNPTAARLWEWLEQERDVEELTALMCERFAVSPEQARADVEACCQQLVDLGAVEACP